MDAPPGVCPGSSARQEPNWTTAGVEDGRMIEVRQIRTGDPMEFEVTVKEEQTLTRHRVSMTQETFQKLARGVDDPVRLVEAAFRFLLDREPKESILSRFDITVISRYFPEFETRVGDYLRGK